MWQSSGKAVGTHRDGERLSILLWRESSGCRTGRTGFVQQNRPSCNRPGPCNKARRERMRAVWAVLACRCGRAAVVPRGALALARRHERGARRTLYHAPRQHPKSPPPPPTSGSARRSYGSFRYSPRSWMTRPPRMVCVTWVLCSNGSPS